MTKEVKENFILLKEDISFDNFKKEFSSSYSSDSVIVDLSSLEVTASELGEIAVLSDDHKKDGMSFVVLLSSVNIDDVDESLTVAITLQEAKDILSMEDLERELGF